MACSALAAVAAAKPWVEVHTALGRSGPAVVPGALQPYAQSAPALALALVALASWGVLLVLRGRARTAVAVVGLLFALGLLTVTVLGYSQVPDAVRQAMHDQLGASASAAATVDLPHTGWYWLALAVSAASVATLALAVRRARQWPAMGTRYDAPGHTAPGDQDMWRTLDEGGDPTDPGSA